MAAALRALENAASKMKLGRMTAADEAIQRVTLTQLELQARLHAEHAKSTEALMRVSNSWREALRLAKTEEVRAALQLAADEFERDVELRDARVNTALRDLSEAEEAHKYAVRTHLQAVGKLLALHTTRAQDLYRHFLGQLVALKRACEGERDGVVAAHSAVRAEACHFLRVAREDAERTVSLIDAEFTQTRETVRRKGIERIHALQTEMDAVIESLEAAFEDAHSKYLLNTEQRVQDFKALAARGQYETHMKDRQKRAIARLQERLVQREAKLMFVEREEEEKNGTLVEERARVAALVAGMKTQLAGAQAAAAARLKRTGVAAAAAAVHMRQVEGVATAVLTLAGRASELEPLTRLIQPLPADAGAADAPPADAPPVDAAAADAAAADAAAGRVATLLLGADAEEALDRAAPPAMEAMVGEAEELVGFYRRYNDALASKLAVEVRRDALRTENEQLKAALADCLAATTLDATTLASANPLLVVNSRGVPAAPPLAPTNARGGGARSTTVVELRMSATTAAAATAAAATLTRGCASSDDGGAGAPGGRADGRAGAPTSSGGGGGGPATRIAVTPAALMVAVYAGGGATHAAL